MSDAAARAPKVASSALGPSGCTVTTSTEHHLGCTGEVVEHLAPHIKRWVGDVNEHANHTEDEPGHGNGASECSSPPERGSGCLAHHHGPRGQIPDGAAESGCQRQVGNANDDGDEQRCCTSEASAAETSEEESDHHAIERCAHAPPSERSTRSLTERILNGNCG